MNWIQKYVSKKLGTVALTWVFVFVNKKFNIGIDDATINELVTAIMAYIIGQSVVDTAKVVTAPMASQPEPESNIDANARIPEDMK